MENFLSNPVNRLSTLQNMREHLIQVLNIEKQNFCLSTVSNILKRLSFSRKRTSAQISKRNTPETIQARVKVAIKFLEFLKNDKEFIFIDETGFNQSLVPVYGYTKKGQPCKSPGPLKGQNYSVIAAITRGRIIGYQIFLGGIKAEDFGGFLSSLLNNFRDFQENINKYVLFMDNATIHKAKLLKPLLENFQVLYNAPYSPFLNPIEELFGNCKFQFRKRYVQKEKNMLEKILDSVNSIDEANIFSFFMHSVTFLQDCLDEKSIL